MADEELGPPEWTPELMNRVGPLEDPFQEKFCRLYVSGEHMGIGSACYRQCNPSCKPGTSRVEASRLLTKPNIKARIAQLQADAAYVADADRDYTVRRLREEADHATHARDRIKALEKLAVMRGDMVPKVQMQVSGDAEFVELIRQAYQSTGRTPASGQNPFKPVAPKGK